MAVRTIRTMGDSILEKKSRIVEEMTPKLQELIVDMVDTMREQKGVGLAAPQVGILKRIVVIDIGEGLQVFINPQIKTKVGEQTGDEGCLSLPGKNGTVTRPETITVTALDQDLEPFTIEASGLMARAVCHECDHLDGVLYTTLVEGELRDNDDYDDEEYEEEDE
jgi:peptide deformylase